MNNMIEILNLKKGYNGVTVVNIPQLSIKKGESIGLVGNNGAGKTTLFRMMLDLIRPDAGEVLSKEKNVANTEEWKDYTTSYLDEGFLIDYLTPEEYFHFIGGLHNKNKAQIDSELVQFTELFNGEILKKENTSVTFPKGIKPKLVLLQA